MTSLPAYGAEASQDIIPNGSSGGPSWHTVDVTSLVQQGIPNGFVLIAAQDNPTYLENGGGISFAGRSQTDYGPQPTLTYGPTS